MKALFARPLGRLTRHFFQGLFDFGFLSDAGIRSFVGVLLGIAGAFLATGLLLVRVYLVKDVNLMATATPDRYRAAVIGDHAFLIALPMWITAFVTILIGHAIFPDETDLRVLLPLPLGRRGIFAAKLGALAMFVGLAIAVSHLAMAPLFLLTSMGQWAESSFVMRAVAYETSSLLASAFGALAIVAIHGVLVVAVPRTRLAGASAALRSVMLVGAIIVLPLLFLLSGQAGALRAGTPWVFVVPPAWFLGLERFALGDRLRAFHPLAGLALLAVALATLLVIGSYHILYRRFDRAMLHPSMGSSPRADGLLRWVSPRRWRGSMVGAGRTAPGAAVRAFVGLTLRRSVLHHGIVVVLSAIGAGLVVPALVNAGIVDWLRTGVAPARMTGVVVWAPFVLIYVMTFATRTALLLPIEPRANWIFRVTEREDARAAHLGGAVWAVTAIGVLIPCALATPAHAALLGRGAAGSLAVTLLFGWLFVEILLRSWDRIPFTCSFIPGKGLVPQTIFTALFSFGFFTKGGTTLAFMAAAGDPRSLTYSGIVLVVALVMRRRRISRWREDPLVFEDSLPSDVNGLKLRTD